MSKDQLLEGLDSYYGVSENRNMPIYDAIWFVARSITGVPEGKADPMLGVVSRSK